MPLSCVTGCTRTFTQSAHLTKHQDACPLALAFKEKVKQERKARGLQSLLPKAAGRQTTWKERLQRQAQREVSRVTATGSISSSATMVNTNTPLSLPDSVPHNQTVDAMDFDDNPHIPLDPQPNIQQPVPLTRSGRPRREVKLPLRFRNYLPESATAFIDAPQMQVRQVLLIVRDRLVTTLDRFGVWREYPNRPTVDPDSLLTLEDLSRKPPITKAQPPTHAHPTHWPFSNPTIHAAMKWLNNGRVTKSESELTSFVHDVILSPKFQLHHLVGFNAHQENQRLDREISKSDLYSGFLKRTLHIQVPSGQHKVAPVPFPVEGFLYRSILDTIKDAFTGSLAHLLHYTPFKLFHNCPTTGNSERIYGELYNSDAFLAEADKVHHKSPSDPNDPTCCREKVVAALMFSSDATHLADFGNAKAWPIYLMLGNLSKYIRSQPDSGGIYHLAYIPSLPDTFKQFVEAFHPKWRTQKTQILTYCKRELMHEVWKALLDDDFIHAYKYGIVIKCLDGIERQVFPRLFTYSADYPEKVLLATIRDKGICPCPRCLVKSEQLDQLGTQSDRETWEQQRRTYQAAKVKKARALIHKNAKPITGSNVEALLKMFSGVPTINAFVDRLGPACDPSKILVVDLLHEFELGIWKTLFTHLIRLLYVAGSGSDHLVLELDRRFACIPTFGNGTIRKFPANCSEMKKMAARDFEDLLQCSIPAFEGLLEEPHNQRLMELLYLVAEWHALAKLRMHTETTVRLHEEVTTGLGESLRHFRDATCTHFATLELPKEAAVRVRREIAASIGASGQQVISTRAEQSGSSNRNSQRAKTLNLQTIKMHFLGDYAEHIRLFGTSDSYSTQLGENQHRVIKVHYATTNKKGAMDQVGKKRDRQGAFRADERWEDDQDLRTPANLQEHFIISEIRNMPVSLFKFVGRNSDAPSVRNFVLKLQNHLLSCVTPQSENFTEQDRDSIKIRNNTIYEHHTARVNFTTYDLRRDYDVINSCSQPFIMALAPDYTAEHPVFWYAAVLGIFHVEFQHVGAKSQSLRPQTMKFLWIRWLEPVEGHVFGRTEGRLPKLQFISDKDEDAYGFLDPRLVLRGCHFISAFHSMDLQAQPQSSTEQPVKQIVEYHGRRLASEVLFDNQKTYYVGIYVDRDMFMWHLGKGIGHSQSFTPPNSEPDVPVTETANANPLPSSLAGTKDDHHMQVDEVETEDQGSDQGDQEDEDNWQQDDGEHGQAEEEMEHVSSDSESSLGSDCSSDIYDDL